MAIACPYCGFNIVLKSTPPGRFQPPCPGCGQKFVLTIPDDPHQLPAVRPLPTRVDKEDAISPTIAMALGIELPAARQASIRTPTPPRQTAAHRAQHDTPPSLRATAAPTIAPSSLSADDQHADRSFVLTPAASATLRNEASPRNGTSRATGPGAPISPASTFPALAMHQTLGGYELLRKLGQGGMGTVYLARQVSLDRDVAVKVLKQQLAADAQFVARFTREAYAAAQLVHHNVVQIHDIGAQRETHYFSMEFVPGQTLADLIDQQGAIDPEMAAGYILQAARGLKFAHDHGMIHRDIKPDNLLLNDQGIVKIADLGLVKTPGSQQTMSNEQQPVGSPAASASLSGGSAAASAHSADAATTLAHVTMGTPSYMAPEQAQDAANVDARADIYSLGCTFYALLTGRPPFEGSVESVIRKHAFQAPVPPHHLAKRIPENLSAIVLTMLAKKPAERYPNIAHVIRALEDYLGVEATGKFSPREEHADLLEQSVRGFNASSFARLRINLIRGFYSLCIAGIAAAAFTRESSLAGGLVGFGVLTVLSYLLISGIAQKSHLLIRCRQLAWGASWGDWLKSALAIVLCIATLFVLNLLWVWLGWLIAAIALAGLFHLVLDRAAAAQRRPQIDQVQQMLRTMRLRGLDEDALRQFVCRYSGSRWEEFYEALFGYEAKIDARKRWGRGLHGESRPRFAAWRDPIIRGIDHKQETRQRERERKHLQAMEARALEAAGEDMIFARRKARRLAEAMVFQATEFRQSMERETIGFGAATLGPDADHTTAVQQPRPVFVLDKDADRLTSRHRGYVANRFGGPLDWLVGQHMRFSLAALLLLGFMAWRYQNRQGIVQEALSLRAERVDPTLQSRALAIETKAVAAIHEYAGRRDQDLEIPFSPPLVRELVGSWSAAVAGALLMFSALFRSNKVGLVVLFAAATTLAGHRLGVPALWHLEAQHVTMILGTGLALLAFVTGRSE